MTTDLRTVRALAAFATALCLSTSALAVHRCADAKGKVTYQDAACDSADAARPGNTPGGVTSRSVGSAPAPVQSPRVLESNPYGDAHGAWRGPAQFQLTVGSIRDASAQLVTPLVIELKATGEVVGVIPESGCNLSGLATQFVAPNMANIDVSMKGCRDARFNARYTGMLASVPSAKEAKLTLNSITTQMPSRKMQVASLEAVLKR
jgi:hypothetical protein